LTGAFMIRGCARCFLGDPGWKPDLDRAVHMVRAYDPTLRGIVLLFKYNLIVNGVWLPDEAAMHETSEMLEIAERFGDDLTLACARFVRGLVLVTSDGSRREDGFTLLAAARQAAVQERFTLGASFFVDVMVATEKLRADDLDGAIELIRPTVDQVYAANDVLVLAASTAALVQPLLRRGRPTDLPEAQAAIDRLAAVQTEPGFVLNDLWLLRMRALMAQSRGDEPAYRDYRDRYRSMSNSLGFEGHIAWAAAME
jgi:adenylate cyclase